MVTIAFYTPQIDIRGSCVALYDYAYYNQTLLGNQSVIIVSKDGKNDVSALLKFQRQFPIFFCILSELDFVLAREKCHLLYVIKYGKNDGIYSKIIPNIIHCVFDMIEPHGEVYVAVSKTLAQKYNRPDDYLPHMVSLVPNNRENLRAKYKIPETAVVIGRHGGQDTFNLDFAKDVIKQVLDLRKDLYFIFVNTPLFHVHPRIIHIPFIVDIDEKNRFISTCDAHLEAGTLGHTFGLSIAEFSIHNKPSIVYDGEVWNRAHLDILGDRCLPFKNAIELKTLLMYFHPTRIEKLGVKSLDWAEAYRDYTPEKVMAKFQKLVEKALEA